MNFKNLLALCALAVVSVKGDHMTDSHKKCVQKDGIFIEDIADPTDNRYGCLLPQQTGDEYWKYCVGYDNMNLCYTEDLGNMDVCVRWKSDYNSRGCAMGMWALYDAQKKNEEKRDAARKTCFKSSSNLFLEVVGDSNIDKRFACVTPQKSGEGSKYYCLGLDGKSYCYRPDLGNLSYCDKDSKHYNSRGCGLGLSTLYSSVTQDKKKRDNSEKVCKQKKGIFVRSNVDSDRRFACLLPKQSNDAQSKYCLGLDGKSVCYSQDYGNMPYCNKSDTLQFHSKGCGISLSSLYNTMVVNHLL